MKYPESYEPAEGEVAVAYNPKTGEIEVWGCGTSSPGTTLAYRVVGGVMKETEITFRGDDNWRLEGSGLVVEFTSAGSSEPHVIAASRAHARNTFFEAMNQLGYETVDSHKPSATEEQEDRFVAWQAAYRAAMTVFGHPLGEWEQGVRKSVLHMAQVLSSVAANLAAGLLYDAMLAVSSPTL